MKLQVEPIIKDDYSGGVLRNVSPYKMPPEAVPHAVNFDFDENVGEAVLRKGTTIIGSQIVASKPILGLANLRRRADGSHAILAVVSDGANNDIYAGEAWAKVTGWTDDTKDLKTRFVQFLDSIVRLNGTDASESYDGTTVITTGGVFDLANMPTKKYGINYKDRIHLIDDDGVLYSSSVPMFQLDYDDQTVTFNKGARVTGGTSGATGIIYNDADAGATGTLYLIGVTGTFQNNETITDDGSTPGSATANGVGDWRINWPKESIDGAKDYITTPIDPDNGQKGKCTGVGKVGGLMLIFFERAMYTWNAKAIEPDEIVGIGCSSFESIAVDGENGLLFFANEHGVYVTKGGFPQKISRFVQDYFDNMSSDNYQHIAGGTDGRHYLCSIGDITINNKTIENVVLRYTINSQEWAVRSYPSMPRVFSQYIDGTEVKLLYGDDNGQVFQLDSSAADDNGTPIAYELDTEDFFQPLKGMKKTIKDRIVVHSLASSGAKLLMRADSDNEADWKAIGEIKEEAQEFKNIPIVAFKKARFRIAGRSAKGRLRVQAIEIPNIELTGY